MTMSNSDTPAALTSAPPDPLAWQGRLIAERDDLREKVLRLGEFVKGAVYRSLETEEQKLLFHQQRVMREYLDVLDARVKRFQ
jgi:hypothetical protein